MKKNNMFNGREQLYYMKSSKDNTLHYNNSKSLHCIYYVNYNT